MAISVLHTTSSNGSGSTTTVSVTIPATTAGSCLVVCLNAFNGGSATTISGITLGGSADHWQSAAGVTTNAEASLIWVDPNCAAGQTAVVISGANLAVDTSDGGVVIYEVAGLGTTFAALVDQTHTGTSNLGTAWSSGSTAATTQASEIAIGSVASDPGISTMPAGYTNTTNTGGFSGAGFKILSATGTQVFNGTQASSNIWAAAIVTLKAVSSNSVALPVAQVTINALPVAILHNVALPVAQVTIAALPLAAGAALALQVAQVTIAALPVRLPLVLPTAAVTVQALAVGVPRSVQLARAAVTVTAYPLKLPRVLLVAIASAAGVDDYGNTYPRGIQVGGKTSPQIQALPGIGGSPSELVFPVPTVSPVLSNTPNVAVGVGATVELVISGPALGIGGDRDWVQIIFFANDGAGTPARMEFRYINDAGVSTTMASFDSAGWVFEQAMQAANGLVVNGNPVTFNQQLTVNANTFLNGTLSADSGAIFSSGAGDLTIGNGFTLTPKMATPPNTAAVKATTATLAQTEACLGALIQSMQNRGMIS
jgi:hypothetical protein